MRLVALLIITIACSLTSAIAQPSLITFDRPAESAGATLRLLGPYGNITEFSFGANQPIVIDTNNPNGKGLSDGFYWWELTFAPRLNTAQQQALNQRHSASSYDLPQNWPNSINTHSGSFVIENGQILDSSDDVETSDEPALNETPENKIPNPSAPLPSVVFAEDLIVQGSGCIGFDCLTNENFGSDTLRLKENNLRIHFDDTSTGSFPSNDWALTINDTTNGGANRFSITDRTSGRDPLTIQAGAIANALFISTAGDLGVGTNTPVVEVHAVDGNTPTVRLDQNNTNGFTPQVWDLAANEVGFFIRDVTSSSTLPFRVMAGGAPTNSLVIDGNGDVALNRPDADAALHIRRSSTFTDPWLLLDLPDDGNANTEERLIEVDPNGNLFVGGTITQLSSRHSKENFIRIAGQQVLEQLSQLPIWTWNYQQSSHDDRHIGPVAEDFYQLFQFGTNERSVAPADMAGVALAASQALQQQLQEKDNKIAELETRLARLESLLSAGNNTGTDN